VAESNVTVIKCSFTNGLAQSGGVIFILGRSNLTVIESSFTNNFALSQGGAISALSFNKILIKNSLFEQNRANDKEGDVLFGMNG